MKWILVAAFLIATVFSLAFGAQYWPSASTQHVEKTGAVETNSALVIQGIGYVEPLSEVRQLAFKTGGVIKECCVKVGDVVHKGEPLMKLHDEKPAAAVLVARKQLEVVRAEEAQARSGINRYRILAAEKTVLRFQAEHRYAASEAERTRRIFDRRATSQSDMDSADSRLWQLDATVKQAEAELQHLKNYFRDVDEALMKARVCEAQARLELAEEQLREVQLVAPFDGTVLKLLKRSGEGVRMVEPEPVLLFGDLARIRIRAEIDERFVKDLKVDQMAEAYGRNLFGKSSAGRIAQIEKIMGDKTVFTRASSERKDLHVLQVVIVMEQEFTAPVGLQVDVRIHTTASPQSR